MQRSAGQPGEILVSLTVNGHDYVDGVFFLKYHSADYFISPNRGPIDGGTSVLIEGLISRRKYSKSFDTICKFGVVEVPQKFYRTTI